MKVEARRTILPVTLGSAGHIDHGKTTLLRALAGAEGDTDRLSEERERGLTIDVGYTELALDEGTEVGVVDVPGHERFVRNMVAGATGIDVVMLVVAADDGVMPQTREHLQIMSLLGLASGVVAITKADTVDEEMVELVRSDVEDLVRGTFLEGAQVVATSAATGQGLEELRAEIARLVRAAPRRDADGFFRMPILRAFTSPGFGTVVTGIPVSGRVRVGERLEVQPGSRPGRVRGLQVYHRPAEEAAAGHRTALNLTDLEHRAVRRGDVVCAAGVFDGAELLDVKLQLLASVPRPLRHDQEVRLHVGTLECAARVLLVGRKQLVPGDWSWAQLKLDRPAVTAPGDRFILRVPAQLETLGGGVVLGPGRHHRRRGAEREREFAERERGLGDLEVAVEALLRRAGLAGSDRARAARELKRREEEIEPVLARLAADGRAAELGRGVLVHGERAASGEERLLAALERFHAKNALAFGMRKAVLPDEIGADAAVLDGLLERLRARGAVETVEGGRVRLAGRTPKLTEEQAQRRERILEILRADPWQSPRSDDLAREVGGLPQETEQLFALLEDEGLVLRLRDGVMLPAEAVEEAKARIAAHVREKGALVPADLKELCGASRKYSIPLLEHLDATGFTRRQGDVRLLRG